jgi:hypothetical protein
MLAEERPDAAASFELVQAIRSKGFPSSVRHGVDTGKLASVRDSGCPYLLIQNCSCGSAIYSKACVIYL